LSGSSENEKRNEPNEPNGEPNDSNANLINLIAENNRITYATIAKESGLSRATVQHRLQEMKEAGLIKRVGGTRGYWEVKKE
jgi:ATP-dependent DNA helicase RecG